MPQPYVGEIRIFAGTFAPAGWEFCDGRVYPINDYETLFALIGTTYGGDGETTFAVPDLRGRIPVHFGAGRNLSTYQIGESFGVESVTLSTQQMPAHNHALLASSAEATVASPNGALLATSNSEALYAPDPGSASAAMAPVALSVKGGSQPHDNMMPYLCVNFIISLYGIYPLPN